MQLSADTIRLFLEEPKQEVDRWLGAWVETQEATRESCGLYDWLAADPERRAKDYPGPMEKHRHILTLTCWPEKARDAEVWLRNAGMVGEANMIDAELRKLVESRHWPDAPRDEAEYGNSVDALHTAAKRIKAILTACSAESTDSPGTTGNLIERLLAGPDDAELTARELASLAAHLHINRPRMSWYQQQNRGMKCPELERHQKLKTILDFNRNLQTALAPTTLPPTGNPGEGEGIGGNEPGSTPPPVKAAQGERNVAATLHATTADAANKIRQLSDEIRHLPIDRDARNKGMEPDRVGEEAAKRLREAIELGACSGAEYVTLRNRAKQSGRPPENWDPDICRMMVERDALGKEQRVKELLVAWNFVAEHVLDDRFKAGLYGDCALGRIQSWSDACERVADLLNQEAARIAIPTSPPTGTPRQNEGNGKKNGRGRRLKGETPALADFAKAIIEKGLGWVDVRDAYLEQHPKKARELIGLSPNAPWDEDYRRRLSDKLRSAYNTIYGSKPPKKTEKM